MTEKNKDHHEELLDHEWEKSERNTIIEALKSGKKIAEIIKDVPGFQKAFDHRLTCLECSDGRVCSGAKLGLPGASGILLSEEGKKILAEVLRDKGLLLTGHESCGAAALAHPGDDSDKYGYENVRALATVTGNSYGEVYKDQFVCSVHNERSLVLEGTGRFDCANWKEFPAQFINSAPFLGLPDGDIKNTVTALSQIAFSDHGYGQRFNAQNPFYVIVSADSQEKLDHLLTLAHEAVKDFGDKVKVDGFIAPDKK
jgi:hypothetical protein